MTSPASGPRACILCGTMTRGRVRGHACCVQHYNDAELLFTQRDRAFDYGNDGGVVAGSWDLDARRMWQPQATVTVESFATPAGGRVVLRVVEGDGPEAKVIHVILRPRTADALADMLEASGNAARLLQPIAVPVVPAEAPADLTASEERTFEDQHPTPSGDQPGEEPR